MNWLYKEGRHSQYGDISSVVVVVMFRAFEFSPRRYHWLPIGEFEFWGECHAAQPSSRSDFNSETLLIHRANIESNTSLCSTVDLTKSSFGKSLVQHLHGF